jgi:hypothetical protein
MYVHSAQVGGEGLVITGNVWSIGMYRGSCKDQNKTMKDL